MLTLASLISLSGLISSMAQSQFQNLNFEMGNPVSANDPGGSYLVTTTSALPHWTVEIGGAAASSDSTKCEHCGARLATVSCPSCFGMMFLGAKFCSHCGAAADRTEVAGETKHFCPRCKTELQSVLVGKTHLEECPRCEGIWADPASLQQVCADREQQTAVLGMPTSQSAESAPFEEHIHYIPCPVCKQLMNRVNFDNCSGVVVNVCGQHGTWMDKDELRRIVEFVRAGGLDKARQAQIDELKERELRAQSAPVGAIAPEDFMGGDPV
jgi:Zn-finger nucleic acid-binding protein